MYEFRRDGAGPEASSWYLRVRFREAVCDPAACDHSLHQRTRRDRPGPIWNRKDGHFLHRHSPANQPRQPILPGAHPRSHSRVGSAGKHTTQMKTLFPQQVNTTLSKQQQASHLIATNSNVVVFLVASDAKTNQVSAHESSRVGSFLHLREYSNE
jgi:hypothetical protein